MTEARGGYGDLGYTYDEAGNRLSRDHNDIPEPYTYAADSHQLLEAGMRQYRYDANGIPRTTPTTGSSMATTIG